MGGPAGPCLAAGTEHGWVEQPHGLMVIVDDCCESTTSLFDTMSARMKLVSGEVTVSAVTMKLTELFPAGTVTERGALSTPEPVLRSTTVGVSTGPNMFSVTENTVPPSPEGRRPRRTDDRHPASRGVIADLPWTPVW